MKTKDNFYLKTWYEDENGNRHHVSIELFEGVNLETFYHCIVDGTQKIDIQMGEELWKDVENKNGILAQQIGEIIEGYSE